MAKVYMSDPAIPIIKRNESAAMRFSSYIKNSRSKTVFQGQPTYLSVRNITFTTANFFFKYVGTPLYYEISLADGTDSRVFYIDHSVFVSSGSVKLESLRPSNTYTVRVVAHYVSDDKYSGNQIISFNTLVAQGAVSDITATNPTNQKYIVDSNNFVGTSFDISFVPLIDNVRYEVILSLDNNNNTGEEPVINIIQPTVIKVTKLPFNTRVDISVNSIYGESNSIYKYSKKITHQTLNESIISQLSIAKVYNKAVDLSYTYVPNVVYSLYINDVSTVSHNEYSRVFNVSDLSIDQFYGNTYVSVTYPESGNEYKNLAGDLGFTTLNEENSHIISSNTIIKNTEITVKCTPPIGVWKNIYFLKDGVRSDLSNTFSHVFSDLSINTSYDISVETVYENNKYTETQRLTTLHEGPIKDCTVSHPDIYTTSLNFTPSPNQADISTVTYTYRNFNNLENIVYISSDTNYVELKDLPDGIPVYTISFESIYKTENRSYPFIISFETIDTDLNEYNKSTELSVFYVTGNTITLDISKGQYYNSHDISYNSTVLPTGKWSDNKYTIQNLERDISYTIGVKSYIADISYIHKESIVQRTLNEGAVDISRVIVSDTSARISWTNKNEVISLNITNKVLNITNKVVDNYTYDLSNLMPNTPYIYSYNTIYKSGNTYTKYLYFTTLNEYPPDISATTYFNTPLSGNTTIIEVIYTNPQAVKETTINIGGNSYQIATLDFSMISQYRNYSGNVVTKYKDTASSGYVSYQTNPYTTDFSFSTIMYKPIYTVSSHDISMDWYDNQNASYIITIDNKPISNSILVDPKNIHVDDLSANTSFNISLKRTYLPSSDIIITSQSIKTLNQGNSIVTGDSIIESWGLGGLNVVLDISNINQTDVSCTFLYYRRHTDTGDYPFLKNTDTTIFDLVVERDISYDFFATTVYKTLTSELKNVKYTSGSYNSNIYSFKPNQTKPYTESNVGNWQDLQSGWTRNSAIISANDQTSTNIKTKYLKPDISNIILYKTENKSSVASVKRHIDYLLKDFYTIRYYVANHVAEGFPFSYRQADRDIEYQLKIISNMSKVVLWETTKIVSTDVSWNKVEIKFYLPNSAKDVTFSLERTQFEFNNLFISDVSIVGNGKSFPTSSFFSPYDHASYNKSLWNTPRQTRYSKTWKEIMEPDDPSSSRKVFTLATNMTIGFWLYVHDIPDDNKEKGIFILGSGLETGCPTISINEETLYVKNKGTVLIQKQYALTKKIPVYFSITFDQKKVSLYKNGVADVSYCSLSYLSEADWEGNIYFGTPSVLTYGYIMHTIEMQPFPLSDTQVSDSYDNTKTQYSSIGNYSDISGNVIISNNIMSGSIHSSTVSIDFSLNNQKTLRKTISTYDLSFPTGSGVVTLSLPSLPPSLSLAFWGNSLPTGNIFDFKDNNVSLFKLIVDNSSIYTNINTSLKIPMNVDLQHFSWTFDGYTGESKSYLNGYLYDISVNTPLSSNLNINSFSRSSSTSGSIGEFQIYNKVLSQSEILTAYYNHYSLDYTYDLSGLYRVRLHVPSSSGTTPVSYHIYGNNYNLNTVGGNISTSSGTTISSRYIDISMSPTDLNNFNGYGDSSFNFVLSDYNIITQVKSRKSPYISVDVSGRSNVLTASQISINESDTLYMKLNNALSDVSYSYLISGIDNSQIQGNVLFGNIQLNKSLEIKMRQDYKTQNTTNNNMVFSIANLGLAVSFILIDSTKNMLTTDLSFAKFGNTFVISLIPPTNNVVDFSYTITKGSTFVFPSDSSGVFHRTDTGISSIDLSFVVTTQLSSEKFILSLDDNDSEVIVILNDIEVPTLDVSGGLNNYQVDEGQIVDLTIKTPQKWADNRYVYFYIDTTNTGITKEDISRDLSYNNDGSYNYIGMSGYFSIQSARATMRFNIAPNKPYSEGTETLKFILSEYLDVSASIVILDTVKPPSFSWSITDVSDNVITQINEGGTFKFTLVTSGVDSRKDISYNITGITRDSISISDNTLLSGVFNVGGQMSRTITIENDLTTTGNKTFVVSTNLGDLNILDQYASIIINDTSQSPNITISSTVDRPRMGAYFSIIVAITNYNFLTDVQKGEQLHYKFYTGTLEDTNADISVPGTTNPATDGIIIIRNGQYSAINSYMNHTFTFLCKTADQKTFTFLLGEEGGKSLTVVLNKQ